MTGDLHSHDLIAIESQHGGKATFAHEMPVTETWQGQTVWDGVVSVLAYLAIP